jgi:hypothetical protein
LRSPAFGKFDDSAGDETVSKFVVKAKGYTGHFQRGTQNPFFKIDIEVVYVRRDRHAVPRSK